METKNSIEDYNQTEKLAQRLSLHKETTFQDCSKYLSKRMFQVCIAYFQQTHFNFISLFPPRWPSPKTDIFLSSWVMRYDLPHGLCSLQIVTFAMTVSFDIKLFRNKNMSFPFSCNQKGVHPQCFQSHQRSSNCLQVLAAAVQHKVMNLVIQGWF